MRHRLLLYCDNKKKKVNNMSQIDHDKIQQYCHDGDEACRRLDFQGGLDCYQKAMELIPEPQTDH